MLLSKENIRYVVSEALKEDAAFGDITTLTFIPASVRIQAMIFAKEDGVVCGIPLARETFKVFDPKTRFNPRMKDGQSIKKGQVIAIVTGRARSILSCERVALNFISYLSGISTDTQKAVRRVKSRGIQILDTRKTTPLLRVFEKYAVLSGGGKNHRLDLSKQYLVKDNHLSILRKSKKLSLLSERALKIPFEIEVESLEELKSFLFYFPDIIMLDNFSPENIRKAIRVVRQMFPVKDKRPLIELSGGITPLNLSQFAIRGVDFISLGALTHSARALDISLEIIKVYSR